MSSSEVALRFAMSRSQALNVLSRLIATGAVRRLGARSAARYVALQALPAQRGYGARPRRLGFLDELRRRRASLAGEADLEDEPATAATP